MLTIVSLRNTLKSTRHRLSQSEYLPRFGLRVAWRWPHVPLCCCCNPLLLLILFLLLTLDTTPSTQHYQHASAIFSIISFISHISLVSCSVSPAHRQRLLYNR